MTTVPGLPGRTPLGSKQQSGVGRVAGGLAVASSHGQEPPNALATATAAVSGGTAWAYNAAQLQAWLTLTALLLLPQSRSRKLPVSRR